MVPHLTYFYAGLLFDFATHGFLDALTLVHEPCQRRVRPRPRQPAPTLPEQAALTITHNHNDDRIGAGKMVGLAGQTLTHLATTALFGMLTAHTAELVTSVPVELGPTLRQNTGLRGTEGSGRSPCIFKPP